MNQAMPTETRLNEELEGNYSLYSSSLRVLMQGERNIDQIKQSFCWGRLMKLHFSLPHQYQDPHRLYLQFMLDNAS
jgi:hypothetical protein